MDRFTPQQRSFLMSQIKSRDTKPEMAVRQYLHGLGLRYKLHDRTLPGSPDLVFKSRKVAIFVHGCFWHHHQACKKGRIPETRQEYWQKKLEMNVARDKRLIHQLRSMGWRVLVIWECQITEKHLTRLYLKIIGKEHAPEARNVNE